MFTYLVLIPEKLNKYIFLNSCHSKFLIIRSDDSVAEPMNRSNQQNGPGMGHTVAVGSSPGHVAFFSGHAWKGVQQCGDDGELPLSSVPLLPETLMAAVIFINLYLNIYIE